MEDLVMGPGIISNFLLFPWASLFISRLLFSCTFYSRCWAIQTVWMIYILIQSKEVFPGGSDVKESTCSAGDPVWPSSQDDPLKNGMGTHSSILTWREQPGRLQSTGVAESDTTEWLIHTHTHTHSLRNFLLCSAEWVGKHFSNSVLPVS